MREHQFRALDARGRGPCRICGGLQGDARHARWPQTWTLNHDPGAVKAARLARRMSQRELVAELGISESYLSEIENGKRSANPALLQRIADALGCPVDSLEHKGMAA